MRRLTSDDQPVVTIPGRRGDAAKIIIITVCVFAMIVLLFCVGIGVYGYVWVQRNFARAMVTAASDINKITGEITDIAIPPQFTPVMGSAFLGMKSVNYAWNPDGKHITMENWHESQGPLLPMLSLMETGGTSPPSVIDQDFQIPEYKINVLKSQYVDYKHEVKEFTIRGRKCQFLFVTGRPKEGALEDEMLFDEAEEAMLDEDDKASTEGKPAVTEDKPADATAPAEAPATAPTETPPAETAKPAEAEAKPLPPVRSVSGTFPGKSGSPANLEIRVPAEGTDEDFLLKIIQSIK